MEGWEGLGRFIASPVPFTRIVAWPVASSRSLRVLRKFINVKDFNHNNSIVGLSIAEHARGHYTDGEPLPPSLLVTFHSGFGLAAQFACSRVEVIGADWAIDGPLGSPMPDVG